LPSEPLLLDAAGPTERTGVRGEQVMTTADPVVEMGTSERTMVEGMISEKEEQMDNDSMMEKMMVEEVTEDAVVTEVPQASK
jgi:hypothetical protein